MHFSPTFVRTPPVVNRLQSILEAAGIRVWRDTKDLWPGDDWEARIREAIRDNALVFVACFSQIP